MRVTTTNDTVEALIAAYFEGLYHSDAAALAYVFHPRAMYFDTTSEPRLVLSMAEYLPIVARRASPASRGEPRRDEIVEIRQLGPDLAFAHVRCALGARRFQDALTCAREAGRWQIVAKAFHYDLES